MFNLFPKKPIPGAKQISFSLSGLHCSSCAVNIDLSLEDLPGILESSTNYAKSIATISYDETKVDPKKIITEIEKLGYQTKSIN